MFFGMVVIRSVWHHLVSCFICCHESNISVTPYILHSISEHRIVHLLDKVFFKIVFDIFSQLFFHAYLRLELCFQIEFNYPMHFFQNQSIFHRQLQGFYVYNIVFLVLILQASLSHFSIFVQHSFSCLTYYRQVYHIFKSFFFQEPRGDHQVSSVDA